MHGEQPANAGRIGEVRLMVGRRVADGRNVAGMSQAQLAAKLANWLGKPVDPSTITRLELGRRPISVEEIVALALILGVEPGQLLTGGKSPVDPAATDVQMSIMAAEYEAAAGELEQAAGWLTDRSQQLRRHIAKLRAAGYPVDAPTAGLIVPPGPVAAADHGPDGDET